MKIKILSISIFLLLLIAIACVENPTPSDGPWSSTDSAANSRIAKELGFHVLEAKCMTRDEEVRITGRELYNAKPSTRYATLHFSGDDWWQGIQPYHMMCNGN